MTRPRTSPSCCRACRTTSATCRRPCCWSMTARPTTLPPRRSRPALCWPGYPRTAAGAPACGAATPPGALAAEAVCARLPENRGGGAALRIGYALMVAAGAGAVVTMDADGQHQPEEIARLLAPVLSGPAELVQGSRVLGSSEPGAFARELGISLFNRLVRVLTGVRVTDCSNSFRAIRTDLLTELDLRQPQFHAAEFLIECLTRGFVFEEVPVGVLSRRHGRSQKPATGRYGLGLR